MLAARQGAFRLARQLPRPARSFASDSHKPAAAANESFGKGSIATIALFFGGVLFYQFTPKKGEESFVTNLISKYTSRAEHWEEINALHTKAMEQAGYDRNLFENASNKHRFVDVTYPEAFQSHAPRNIQAGQLMHLDKVVEHYRQQHLKEEERKMKRLADKET